MDKPTKPTNLIPRSFGGVKNNFSSSLQSSGYEDGVPAIYGGDNLNYQLDATGKELDYCEKICDYINAIPINKTPIVDANNKLVYTQYDIRVYSASETYYIGDYVTGVVDSVKHIYQSLKDNNIGQSLSNETYWKKVDIISDIKTIGRNIGEIIPSTIPLTDAGLHLLDGALIQGSGSYSAFVTYIADLYDSGDYTAIFDTEANWQSAVANNGVCGKFVYDSVNNTVRLPQITGIIEGTTDLTALGDLVEAGLPNITGSVNTLGANLESVSGAFGRSDNSVTNRDDVLDLVGYRTLSFNASHSNSIYGNSNTVQPQTIKILYYIVIATSTKTDIEVDIDEIATDLNGKADVDLTNVSNTSGFRKLVEIYNNGTDWYKVYSEYNPSTGVYIGQWCEQGGIFTGSDNKVAYGYIAGGTGATANISLLKNFANTNYSVYLSGEKWVAGDATFYVQTKLTDKFSYTWSGYNSGSNCQALCWYACGYLATT